VTRQREIRARNLEIVERAELPRSKERLPLLCECGDPGCYEFMLLRAEEYRRRYEVGLVTSSEHRR
jgi:hypothetical protein